MQSWSWSLNLSDAVGPDDSVAIPTPGLDLALADTANAELNVGGVVITVGEGAAVSFADDGSSADVQNLTDEVWQAGVLLYLYVPQKEPDGEGVETLTAQVSKNTSDIAANASAITALDGRVTTLEGGASSLNEAVNTLATEDANHATAIGDLQSRVTALETANADHETRIAALEAAAAEP